MVAWPRGSKRSVVDEYARDVRGREPRAAARRRVRTVREFARFLSPRPLEEASPQDLSEWAITKVQESERAERRADLADFYEWHRAREAPTGPAPAATMGDGPASETDALAAQPEHQDGKGTAAPPETTTATEEELHPSREPVRVQLGHYRPPSRYSVPKRVATALLLVVVTSLWMVMLVVPDTTTGTRTTTTARRTRSVLPTTAPMHPRSEVTVLSVNASGAAPRGEDLTRSLADAGFKVVPPEQAGAPVPSTTVYWTRGYEREAKALADAVQVPVEIGVGPVPDPPPVPDMKGANVVVVIGQDLAA